MSRMLCRLLRVTSSRHAPAQVALAIAWGVLCGLLPKLSVLFAAFACLTVLLPVHLMAFAASAAVVSILAYPAHAAIGSLGLEWLHSSSLNDWWTRWDAIGMLAWVGLQNSLVLGGCIVGSLLFIPTFGVCYLLLKPMLRKPSVGEDQWSVASEQTEASQRAIESSPETDRLATIASQDSLQCEEPRAAATDASQRAVPVAGDSLTSLPPAAVELQQVLNDCHDTYSTGSGSHVTDTAQTLGRAVEITSLVDELLADLDSETFIEVRHKTPAATPSKYDNTPLPPASANPAAPPTMSTSNSHPLSAPHSAAKHPPTEGIASGASEPAQRTQLRPGATVADSPLASSTDAETPGPAIDSTVVSIETRHEEALRYLLHHLKTIRDRIDH
ncbi:DUF2062 domain-containing protein [Aureliella helgolandensis]|uniref:Uncharacterized protein n=1 Tax=Aureliella helgolandensis TaxID=2527968 RepID=A0A518G8I7_9BACT|nr:DUF2062 domain-containing protein [Aureliella helgolandensis]QDV24894.1 hypothetical protein Q31a_32160 [Aureliella helgolandensis]